MYMRGGGRSIHAWRTYLIVDRTQVTHLKILAAPPPSCFVLCKGDTVWLAGGMIVVIFFVSAHVATYGL